MHIFGRLAYVHLPLMMLTLHANTNTKAVIEMKNKAAAIEKELLKVQHNKKTNDKAARKQARAPQHKGAKKAAAALASTTRTDAMTLSSAETTPLFETGVDGMYVGATNTGASPPEPLHVGHSTRATSRDGMGLQIMFLY